MGELGWAAWLASLAAAVFSSSSVCGFGCLLFVAVVVQDIFAGAVKWQRYCTTHAQHGTARQSYQHAKKSNFQLCVDHQSKCLVVDRTRNPPATIFLRLDLLLRLKNKLGLQTLLQHTVNWISFFEAVLLYIAARQFSISCFKTGIIDRLQRQNGTR